VAKARPSWRQDKFQLPLDPAALTAAVVAELDAIQAEMLEQASLKLAAGTRRITSFAEMAESLARADDIASSARAAGGAETGAAPPGGSPGNSPGDSDSGGGSASAPHLGFFLAPWRADDAAEAAVKELTRATIRCYPLDEAVQAEARGQKCFFSGEPATHMALFARAF
jgi:prolyl-tRNA synthetase